MVMMMMLLMMIVMLMMMMMIIIINWLQVRRIRLQVTNDLVTVLSYSQASSFEYRSDLDLALRS